MLPALTYMYRTPNSGRRRDAVVNRDGLLNVIPDVSTDCDIAKVCPARRTWQFINRIFWVAEPPQSGWLPQAAGVLYYNLPSRKGSG